MNNNRYNPVINGFKVCKICNKSKELTTQFLFHPPTGYYLGMCKECKNKKDRLNRPLLSGRREESVYIRQKTCLKCKISKDINSENFTTSGNVYAKVCRQCTDIIKEEKKNKILSKGYKSDDHVKTCNICKENKKITEYSFSRKYKFYSYCCKSCDTNRKRNRFNLLSEEEKEKIREKGRNYHRDNKPKSLRVSYNTFDNKRNLQNDLTVDYIANQLLKPCTYCTYSSTGLDRLDNKLGHLQSNCVPCCWECNTAKMDNFTHEEMLIIGKAIKEVKNRRLYTVGIDPIRQINKN